MTRLSEIIIEARKKAGLSQSELARRLNLTPQAVQAWESGRSTPRANVLAEVATVLGTSRVGMLTAMLATLADPVLAAGNEYIATQNAKAANLEALADRSIRLGQQLDSLTNSENSAAQPATDAFADMVPAPFLKEMEIPAGNGRTTVMVDQAQTLRLEARLLREQGVEFENAVCANVHGDSMAPLLPDGCTVAVDIGSTFVRDGKTYAINQNGQLRVRTLSRIPGGGVRFRSINREEYPDEEYSPEAMEAGSITIIGRVFWSSVVW